MHATVPCSSAVGPPDNFSQGGRCTYRLDLPGFDNGPRDPFGERVFAPRLDQIGQFSFGQNRDQVAGGGGLTRGGPCGWRQAYARGQPHVQGAFFAEGKAPLGTVQVGGGHAQVGQQSIGFGVKASKGPWHLRKGVLPAHHAQPSWRHSLGGELEILGIQIHQNQVAFGANSLGHLGGMTASAGGAIDGRFARLKGQSSEDLIHEDRLVSGSIHTRASIPPKGA